MKSITRKLTLLAAGVAFASGSMFFATPKAHATLYICYLMGCDSTYCYYACQPLLGG